MSTYTLMGSTTSPFVRRLRIMMNGLDFDFKTMMIFDPSDRKELKKATPILKIPILKINDEKSPKHIYDSRVIFNYLNKKHWKKDLSIDEENLLTVIDGVNDSLVTLYMMTLSQMTIEEDKRFIMAQRERIAEGFSYLADFWADNRPWDYQAISLYCLIDWAIFRNLIDIKKWPSLETFWLKHQGDDLVKATDPRS